MPKSHEIHYCVWIPYPLTRLLPLSTNLPFALAKQPAPPHPCQLTRLPLVKTKEGRWVFETGCQLALSHNSKKARANTVPSKKDLSRHTWSLK